MALRCRCGNATIERTSWTNLNPGRRYASCVLSQANGGCDFFVWLDPPMCERSRQIIPGLSRRVNALEAQFNLGGALVPQMTLDDQLVRIQLLENELAAKKKSLRWMCMALVIGFAVYVMK